VAQMIFSSGNNNPNETDMTLISQAVRWAWQKEGNDADIDTVYEYLGNFNLYSSEGGEIREAASRLAFNLADFRSGGAFGRFVNGRSTFDISNDDFVVLELERLLPKKVLFKVVTLQVINAVTMDLYLSDRSDRRLICFDEASQFLGESSTLKQVIEEGYRRARKYHGSFTICLQSVLDTLRFGAVGNVIRENSAFKFYLESTTFEEAKRQGVLDYDEFTMHILKSTKSLVCGGNALTIGGIGEVGPAGRDRTEPGFTNISLPEITGHSDYWQSPSTTIGAVDNILKGSAQQDTTASIDSIAPYSAGGAWNLLPTKFNY